MPRKKVEKAEEPVVNSTGPNFELKPVPDLQGYCRRLHELVKELANEQSCRVTSGSQWKVNFEHRLQELERDMGWGPGPKTEKPV